MFLLPFRTQAVQLSCPPRLHAVHAPRCRRCMAAGADIVKFATMATDITDARRVLHVLEHSAPQRATIALAMGERGQITRLLAPKYGGFLTFGALSPERQSAPGQPTLRQLRELYRLQAQGPASKVFGIVGNPVSHRYGCVLAIPISVDAIHISHAGGDRLWGFSLTCRPVQAATVCSVLQRK